MARYVETSRSCWQDADIAIRRGCWEDVETLWTYWQDFDDNKLCGWFSRQLIYGMTLVSEWIPTV